MEPTADFDFQSEYFFDSSGFKIMSRGSGWRMFMLSSNAWRTLTNELYKRFSSGAEVIMFDMGVSYSSELVALLASTARGAHPGDFKHLLMKNGWGKITVGGDLELGTHLAIVITDCVFCGEDGDIERNCPFMRGASLGVASALFKSEYKVSSKCNRNKSEIHVCKFELTSNNLKF